MFYRVSVWLVSLFPTACLTQIFWTFYPREISVIAEWGLPLALYAILCGLITWKLRKKK